MSCPARVSLIPSLALCLFPGGLGCHLSVPYAPVPARDARPDSIAPGVDGQPTDSRPSDTARGETDVLGPPTDAQVTRDGIPPDGTVQTVVAPVVARGTVADWDGDAQGDQTEPVALVHWSWPVVERRALAELALPIPLGSQLVSAQLSGSIVANNNFDTGTRTFAIELYEGDGTIDVADFSRSANEVGRAPYDPPYTSGAAFSLPVLGRVSQLHGTGATHVGVRIRSVVDDAANLLDTLELQLGLVSP